MDIQILQKKFSRLAYFFIKVCFICSFIFYTSSTLSQEISTTTASELPLEKVYLHLDKNYYKAGEDIWFKAYLVAGRKNKPSTLSEIIYVELLDSSADILATKIIKAASGSASGDFRIPLTAQSGNYTVRAYTNYIRNFGDHLLFTKTVMISSLESSTEALKSEVDESYESKRPDLQFFPEGGYSVSGFVNSIAFKAINSHGKGIAVSGKIIDDTGLVVRTFKTTHFGMGNFYFIPEKGKNYKAVISHEDKEWNYKLPIPLEEGVLMTVSNLEGFYRIEITGTSENLIKGLILLARKHDLGILEIEINPKKEENRTVVKLDKSILEEGIFELTLIDQSQNPIAERLIFHESEKNSAIAKLNTHRTRYEKRDSVSLEINMDFLMNQQRTADVSLAVTNKEVGLESMPSVDIKTYLLLNSELKGHIENPGYYFFSNEPERKKNLDLLMRTQGWRQYIMNSHSSLEIQNLIFPETGIPLRGKVVSSVNPKNPMTGSVSLISNSSEEMSRYTVETDSSGRFKFQNLDFIDTTRVFLSAEVYGTRQKRKRKPNPYYRIVLDSIDSPDIVAKHKTFEPFENFVARKTENQSLNNFFSYNSEKVIQLDEAVVEAKKIENSEKIKRFERKRKGSLYREPTQTLDFNEIQTMPNQNALLALQGRVPGIVVGSGGMTIAGSNSLSDNRPLILLDGVPLSGGESLDDQAPILADQVDFIDVLKRGAAAIYGERGWGGVIAIYTKDWDDVMNENKEDANKLNFEHPGYDYTRAFYEPKYKTDQSASEKPDYRTTLHWQPKITFNDDGKANITFYTGDITGKYSVNLEGITSEGTPIKTSSSFMVE